MDFDEARRDGWVWHVNDMSIAITGASRIQVCEQGNSDDDLEVFIGKMGDIGPGLAYDRHG